MANTHTFTRNEEIANAVSHGAGIVFSIVALVLLIVFAVLHGTAWHVVSFSLYGSSMLLLYVCSTLLHSLPVGKAKNVFEILDHSSIYLFIAGTYTPLLFIVVKGSLGWTFFGILWGIAVAGIVFKVFFVKKFLFLSTIGYVVMGWMVVFILNPNYHRLPMAGVEYLFAGGILYTIGSVFYVWRKFPYHHMVWHLLVLGGSVCHFIVILFYVLPIR